MVAALAAFLRLVTNRIKAAAITIKATQDDRLIFISPVRRFASTLIASTLEAHCLDVFLGSYGASFCWQNGTALDLQYFSFR
jgi:hypothetical protein